MNHGNDKTSEGRTTQEDSVREISKDRDKEGDFIVVTSRRKGRKSNTNQRGPGEGKFASLLHHDLSTNGSDTIVERTGTESNGDILKKINKCIDHIRGSDYFNKFLESLEQGLKEVTGSSSPNGNLNVLCYGLGPFSSHLLSRIARYQLALLVLVKEIYNSHVEVFDPVFIPQEKSILRNDFGLEVSEVNEEGKRHIEEPTLVYMPHCPHQLVNNFLYANWNPESLTNSFIVCNSLTETLSSIPPRYVDENLLFLRDGNSICKEIPISPSFSDHPDVFNDIALHVFPRKNFVDLSEDFWLNTSCPVYSERDFISNK